MPPAIVFWSGSPGTNAQPASAPGSDQNAPAYSRSWPDDSGVTRRTDREVGLLSLASARDIGKTWGRVAGTS